MRIFVTGTDTDVGKTVVCAWLMLHLKASYWKPLQAGLTEETDSEKIRRLTECGVDGIFPPAYQLPEPLSPHEAARRAGVAIDMARFMPPQTDGPLVAEGAGGVMVPLNDQAFMIDLMESLGFPVVLVCRSGLGTINHTLLSLAALRGRDIPLAGVVMDGPLNPHNRKAIEEFGNVTVLAEIPPLAPLNRQSLQAIQPRRKLRQFFK